MKSKYINLDRRVQTNLAISEETYIYGLLNIICKLFDELEILMKEEGRFSGIVLSYFASIHEAFLKIWEEHGITEDELEIYGKILYLYKPVILREYRFLCTGRLSRADSLITVLNKLIGIIGSESENIKEIATLQKIITRLFGNIRNQQKNHKLKGLEGCISHYSEAGLVGKFILDSISIHSEEEKWTKKEYEGSGILVDEESNKLTEVSWKEK